MIGMKEGGGAAERDSTRRRACRSLRLKEHDQLAVLIFSSIFNIGGEGEEEKKERREIIGLELDARLRFNNSFRFASFHFDSRHF